MIQLTEKKIKSKKHESLELQTEKKSKDIILGISKYFLHLEP